MWNLSHLFGRYTRVPLRTPIKQALVFNPAPVISNSAVIQASLVASSDSDLAMSSERLAMARTGKAVLLFPRIAPVLIFHSLRKDIKNGG